ncbi:MAG: 30S ribosomal protein S24e [Candidatus Njordarchaeales archaeon]
MSLKVEMLSKFENKLLFRTEYRFRVVHDAQGTPSRKIVKETIAKLLNIPEDLVVIRNIKTPFGVNESIVEAFVYDSREKMLEIEPKHILIRNGILKEKEGEYNG